MLEHSQRADIEASAEKLQQLKSALNAVLLGQEALVDMVMVALVAGGHVLLEGLPGLGKTELVKGLCRSLEASYSRIQFTPDLLPSDITGFQVFEGHSEGAGFRFEKGPLFAHLVLADEINRASPKTQSAMLEAMQENKVTLAGHTHALPSPFFVLATQNPIELEGTYPLPEAQLDRFLFKLPIEMVKVEHLKTILSERTWGRETQISHAPMGLDALVEAMDLSRRIYCPEPVIDAVARLVDEAQPHRNNGVGPWLRHGLGPRSALALMAALRSRALLSGRAHASVEDLPLLAPHVLRHRLMLNAEARMEGMEVDDVMVHLLREVMDLDLPSTLAKEST
jgi:MoxR-like ATPase